MFNRLLRLSQHSIIYGLGVTVTSIVGFFLIPVYTRYLTPADYGTLEILNTTLSVLGIIFVMGLTTALFRSYFFENDPEKKKQVVSTVFLFLTITSGLLTLLLVSLAGISSSLFLGSREYTSDFRVIFLTLFCNTGIGIGLAVLRAKEEPTRYALVTISQVVMSLTLNIVFVVVLRKGVLGILESNLITAAVLYLALTWTVMRKAGFGFSLDELKRMLAFGLPLVPAGAAIWVLTLSDRYFLQFFSTSSELGLYSLGYKFGMVISALLVGPFQTAWGPFQFSISKQENARQIYSRVLTYFLLVAMFAALALSVLSKEVIAIMATPQFRGAYKVIPLIALSYVLWGGYYVLAVGFSLEAKTRPLALFTVGAAVLNLILNYLLIPHYGMMGAAGATLACYILLPVFSYLVSQRYYKINYEWGRVLKIFLAAGVIFAGSFFIHYDSVIVTGVLKLLTLLAYPILLYSLRFYHPEEIHKVREIVGSALTYIRKRLGG